MEIKGAIDLLKFESSDHLSILEDLNMLYDNCLIFNVFAKIVYKKHIFICLFKVDYKSTKIKQFFSEADFLSSAMKLFENEKEGDEKIMVYYSFIIFLLNLLYRYYYYYFFIYSYVYI